MITNIFLLLFSLNVICLWASKQIHIDCIVIPLKTRLFNLINIAVVLMYNFHTPQKLENSFKCLSAINVLNASSLILYNSIQSKKHTTFSCLHLIFITFSTICFDYHESSLFVHPVYFCLSSQPFTPSLEYNATDPLGVSQWILLRIKLLCWHLCHCRAAVFVRVAKTLAATTTKAKGWRQRLRRRRHQQ